jgi:hypothetical protein
MAHGMSDNGSYLRDLVCQARHGLIDVIEKVRAEQQIFRRITAEGKLREYHDIRVELSPGAAAGGKNPVGIALDIPDQEVELGHDEAQAR